MSDQLHSCAGCTFSMRLDHLAATLRICRRFPPTVGPDGKMQRPVVHHKDICGEYHPQNLVVGATELPQAPPES